MVLESIRLRDFRCFAALACRLEPVSLFTGANAQGKTSLLEAACVLMRLQSPRTSNLRELVRFGAERFGVGGTLAGREMVVVSDGKNRELKVDGERVARAPDYRDAGSLVVWIGSGDRDLVSGSGDVRRRFLDFVGGQMFADYRPALRAYGKALRSRNALLKHPGGPPWREVEAWTDVLVPHGELLTRRRRKLIAGLEPEAAAAHAAVSGSAEVLSLTWQPGGPESSLAARLRELRGEEAARRVTLAGPHRDDFAPAIGGLPAATFGSEGQQRTVALALKLAQAAVLERQGGRPPVLLIDDVFGELDPVRRNALLRALPAGSQKLITTTHLDWVDGSLQAGRVYRVEAGGVAATEDL